MVKRLTIRATHGTITPRKMTIEVTTLFRPLITYTRIPENTMMHPCRPLVESR